jgi:BlaI family transcriptional regulator, penicillinase repressor
MGEIQLGRVQFQIMQVLWDRGRASAREITEVLSLKTEQLSRSELDELQRLIEQRRKD